MARNWPRGDLVGWIWIRNIFGQGKPLEFLPWIKNLILLMPAVGLKPSTSQSLSGGVIPRLAHHLNHSATEHWLIFVALSDSRRLA